MMMMRGHWNSRRQRERLKYHSLLNFYFCRKREKKLLNLKNPKPNFSRLFLLGSRGRSSHHLQTYSFALARVFSDDETKRRMRAKPRRSGGAGGRASSSSTTTSCARRALLFTAALTVANASQNHQHPRPPHEAASSSISSKQKVLLPITPDNFLGAIAECLEEDSNGSCPKYGEESKYGEMKDWNVSEVTDMDYGLSLIHI